MLLPSAYAGVSNLTEFLAGVLKAYPSVETSIALMIDGSSDTYKAFHYFTVTHKVTTLHVRQYGVTYQINRLSNIRDTAGQEQYVSVVYDVDELQTDETIVTYKTFDDEWSDWVTLSL